MKTFPSVIFFIKIQEIIFKSKVGNYQDLTDLFILHKNANNAYLFSFNS